MYVVRRILAAKYRPQPDSAGPSWLTLLGHAKDSLWSLDLFRCESAILRTHWVLVVMGQFRPHSVGFGVHGGVVDGVELCRMFNRATQGQTPPTYVSSDHDRRRSRDCTLFRVLGGLGRRRDGRGRRRQWRQPVRHRDRPGAWGAIGEGLRRRQPGAALELLRVQPASRERCVRRRGRGARRSSLRGDAIWSAARRTGRVYRTSRTTWREHPSRVRSAWRVGTGGRHSGRTLALGPARTMSW